MFTVVITAKRVLKWNANKSSWTYLGAALQVQDRVWGLSVCDMYALSYWYVHICLSIMLLVQGGNYLLFVLYIYLVHNSRCVLMNSSWKDSRTFVSHRPCVKDRHVCHVFWVDSMDNNGSPVCMLLHLHLPFSYVCVCVCAWCFVATWHEASFGILCANTCCIAEMLLQL